MPRAAERKSGHKQALVHQRSCCRRGGGWFASSSLGDNDDEGRSRGSSCCCLEATTTIILAVAGSTETAGKNHRHRTCDDLLLCGPRPRPSRRGRLLPLRGVRHSVGLSEDLLRGGRGPGDTSLLLWCQSCLLRRGDAAASCLPVLRRAAVLCSGLRRGSSRLPLPIGSRERRRSLSFLF